MLQLVEGAAGLPLGGGHQRLQQRRGHPLGQRRHRPAGRLGGVVQQIRRPGGKTVTHLLEHVLRRRWATVRTAGRCGVRLPAVDRRQHAREVFCSNPLQGVHGGRPQLQVDLQVFGPGRRRASCLQIGPDRVDDGVVGIPDLLHLGGGLVGHHPVGVEVGHVESGLVPVLGHPCRKRLPRLPAAADNRILELAHPLGQKIALGLPVGIHLLHPGVKRRVVHRGRVRRPAHLLGVVVHHGVPVGVDRRRVHLAAVGVRKEVGVGQRRRLGVLLVVRHGGEVALRPGGFVGRQRRRHLVQPAKHRLRVNGGGNRCIHRISQVRNPTRAGRGGRSLHRVSHAGDVFAHLDRVR